MSSLAQTACAYSDFYSAVVFCDVARVRAHCRAWSSYCGARRFCRSHGLARASRSSCDGAQYRPHCDLDISVGQTLDRPRHGSCPTSIGLRLGTRTTPQTVHDLFVHSHARHTSRHH